MKVSVIAILILVGIFSLAYSEITPRFPGTQPVTLNGNSTSGGNGTSQVEDKVVVDSFSVDSPPLVIVLQANAPPAVTDSNFQQDPSILGGERDITLTVTNGSPGRVFNAAVTSEQFTISCPNGASGTALVQYDGTDGSANLSLHPGLGGLDLTQSNGQGFRVSATTDIQTVFTITAYDGSGNKGSASRTVIGDPNIINDYLIPFTEYGNVDFTNIDAIELLVLASENVDFFINTFVTYGDVVNSVGAGSFSGSVLPCDTDYYRLQTLANLTAGDYLKISFNQTGEPGYADSLGTLYIVSSDYPDLQSELASNQNIVDTLGELPGPNNYIYKCDVAHCDIEITSCELQDTTYYFAIAGSDAGILLYSVQIYLRTAQIFQLFAQTPQPVFLDQRPASPDDHTLYYRYYAIDIPESLYSEGTYLVVNISRAEPYPGLEMRLNYGGLPESPANTGVIGATDYDSNGNEVDTCTYQYCVNTARGPNDPYYENPVSSQPRVPCVCTTAVQNLGTSGAFQLTCNLTVDPCQFQYGTWYISVLLPVYSPDNTTIDTANYTLTPYVVQPSITTLFRNVTFKGSVVPERTTHYKLEVPASDVVIGQSHLIVQISNIRNGYVDLWVHQGLGGDLNLAGGPEACVPSNVTCHTRDACNVVVEKCHFSPGTWYIAVSIGYDSTTKKFDVFDSDRLPITYTIRANWLEDPTPTPILAGVPVASSIGEALYDFYVIDIPPTVDTWLFIELYSRCQDTEVILSVLHGSLPGGECYDRPDYYCLTGNPSVPKFTTGPPTNLNVQPVQRQSCTFMIQTCELEEGPLYLSVYGHHTDYLVYGDDTFYQIPVKYTLYVDFDTATPVISNVSYSDNVVNYQYQHYYIRADQVRQGSYLTVEVTNIQHGVPQTIEAFVNYNYLAGNCPCYDHLYNCTGVPRYGYTGPVADEPVNFIPAPECLDTCCTILVPPSDFRSGVWYIAVLGVNQDLTQYTTPIGYTLTVTVHDPPTFIPLMLGQPVAATVPQWNKSLEYTHFKVAAVPLPLNDLVIKIAYVQNCEYMEKHDNLRDTLVMYVRADAAATELGYDYSCSANIQSESYCTIVIPNCEWVSNDYFVAVKGDYDADFIGRFTLRASLEEIRDTQLTSGVSVYDRVSYGTYKHFFIESDGVQNKHLYINLYTNQDQDNVSVYLNLDSRAGTAPCFTSTSYCEDDSFCSWQINAIDLVAGRYYVSVYGDNHQFYDISVEFTLTAEFKPFATLLDNGNPFTSHILAEENQYYRFTVEKILLGDYLTIEVENVDYGSVAVYLNYGTAAGRCPGYLNEYTCSASSEDIEWCELRVPSCELQLGDYYITVVGLDNYSPCGDAHHKIGYNIEVNQITPFLLTPEVDVGRDTTNTLLFEFLPNTRYAHYQFRYTAEDYANGYHIIVEITDVKEGSLYVYYNKGSPSDYEGDCQLAQICTDGLNAGGYCYWQIPFSLSKPVYADANETTLLFNYITVEAVAGRYEASYNILIWKQPPPSIIANPTFTLDNTNSSFFFPANTELNITHFSQNEPYGWVQYFKLTDVPVATDGDIIELFFYRIVNNLLESTAFNVYVYPEEPAGAHECCDHDPSTLGSCENAPILRTADVTTQIGDSEVYSHYCDNGIGTGYDPTGTIPFYGSRCNVRVWPCTYQRYCNNASTWWVSVVPTDPNVGYSTVPLAGLSYSVQWRVRNIRLNEKFQTDSISLNTYINTYNFTAAIPVYSNTTESEGWLSLYIDVNPGNSRISIQTNFLNGSSAVYIQADSFASPPYDSCNYYYCTTNDPTFACNSNTGRFLSNECHSGDVVRYYITVRNLSGPNTTNLVEFRITKIDLPAPIAIPAHLTLASPFQANSTLFAPFNVTGVEGENYDFYVLPIDDADISDHQSLLIDVQRPDVDAGELIVYVRYGAIAGDYQGQGHTFYPSPEGCHDWLYSCSLPTAGSRCTLQIPHAELIQGYWYISIYNPDFLFNGVSGNLPDYSLTVTMSDAPEDLVLGVPTIITNSTIASQFPGTYINYRLNLTADQIGLSGGVTNGTFYSGDFLTTYLRFILEGYNGDIVMYINYDDVAGEATAFYNPFGYYQESLTYYYSCTGETNCYIDIVPCADDNVTFKLKSGYYYVSLLINTATTYNLTAYVLTNDYLILTPTSVNGTDDRDGTSNIFWTHTLTVEEVNANTEDFYYYTLDTGSDIPDYNYFFINFTIPANYSQDIIPPVLNVWRDDCTRFYCIDPLNGQSWCAIDAVSNTPCSVVGGRFYFKVYNPGAVLFTIYFHQNETTVQTLLNEQIITEIVYPYEYQEYYFEAVDVLEGATLAVQICADCGEVEAWVRPSGPAGPYSGLDGCEIDHCTASANDVVELETDQGNCCTLFLDTCQYTQQGYYIAVRGVATRFPNNVNPHLYLPARYQIQAIQTNVQINELNYICPGLVTYNVEPNQVPQQFAIDIETLNIGALLRFTLILPDPSFYTPADTQYSVLTISQNRAVGYTTACENSAYSCFIVSTQDTYRCDFTISAADVATGRYYIWADAPRGSEVVVERWDPYIPIIQTNLVYTASINGPDTGYIFDGPFRPPIQYYRFDLEFDDDDFDRYDETFYLRVIIKDVTHGSLSATLNSGYFPLTSATDGSPLFIDNQSCTIATDGYDCYIELQYCQLLNSNYYDPLYSDSDDNTVPTSKTFFITITGLQQLAELHSIQYSLVVQTSWEFTYFPIDHTICNSVEEGEYNFYRLRPHAKEYPPLSILRFELSDIDVVDGEEVELLLKDYSVPTVDCYDLAYRSGRAVSSGDAVGVGVINVDWLCSYENLYLSVLGINSADGVIDYKMNVSSVFVPVKELFNNKVYRADDDDDDACGSTGDEDQDYPYDFYVFKTVAKNDRTTAFLRVAVDSEYPFEVYVNKNSFAAPECYVAAGSADSGTVNLYDFCGYEDTDYFITVISDGPYSIFTHIRDDAKNLTLGSIFRDTLEQGEYQIYTLEVCKDWFAADDRLVIEIADVENGGVKGWIQKDSNPGPYQSPAGDGVCDIDGTSAFAQYGEGETGYDFILLNHYVLEPGTYHILIQAQSLREDVSDDNDIDPQDVNFRLFPYFADLEIDPINITQNAVYPSQVVDFYTLDRNPGSNPRTLYYEVAPLISGYTNGITFAQVQIKNVQGGFATLRITSGHLATPLYDYFTGELNALTKDFILPGNIQSGRRPYTLQPTIDLRTSYFSNCEGSDGSADYCVLLTDDLSTSGAIWLPSCYFDQAYSLYISVKASYQFNQLTPVTFDLSVNQYHDFVLLPPNIGVDNSMSDGNWEYHFYKTIQPHEQSAVWRVVVAQGDGVLVTVRNNRCPLQATWERELWCDARSFGHNYVCDIEIPTEASHPGDNAFFISVYGNNATYTIAYWRGLENCHVFTHDGLPEGLSFCSGIVDYPTWRYDDYAALDAEASCFFEELYNHFRVQPCWSGVSVDCNATLQQFACYESFRACDANGFYVGTCRSSCNAVVYECVNWFESVDLEHYNCTSSRYIDDGVSTCTGSGSFSQFDINTQLLFGGNPEDILYDPYLGQYNSASSLVFSCLLFLIALLF